MKTLKKLHLRPGQAIGQVQQQFIVAGSGTEWHSNCHCTMKGHTHNEWREVTQYGNFKQVIAGTLETGFGIAAVSGGAGSEVATFGASTPGSAVLVAFGSACIGQGLSDIIDGFTASSLIRYTRTYQCKGINPLTHTLLTETSSVL